MFADKKQKVMKYIDENFKVKYGFLNRFNNKSLFINITSWVTINGDDSVDYVKEFDRFRKVIKQHLYSSLDKEIFDNTKYLVDIDIRRNGLVANSTSYFELELTLFSSEEFFEPNEKLSDNIKQIISSISDTILLNRDDLKFSNKK